MATVDANSYLKSLGVTVAATASGYLQLPTITVRESGGDYDNLAAAAAAAGTGTLVSIEGTWSAADTSAVTASVAHLTFRTDADSRHPGYVQSSPTHYRLEVSGAHAITQNAENLAIDGLVIKQAGTGNSDEGIRVGGDYDLTVTDAIIWAETSAADQDGIYYSDLAGVTSSTLTLKNTNIYGFNRGGVRVEATSSGSTVTANINSCNIWNNGRDDDSSGGGIVGRRAHADATVNINVFNSVVVGNDSGGTLPEDFHDVDATYNCTWDTHNVIDSDGTSSVDSGAVGALTSRTATDNASPGVGDWVIFENITTSPYDLRLKDSSENDAKDAHSATSGAGLTLPTLDITGKTRETGSGEIDIGSFEVLPAVTYTLDATAQALLQKVITTTADASSYVKALARTASATASGYLTGTGTFAIDTVANAHLQQMAATLSASAGAWLTGGTQFVTDADTTVISASAPIVQGNNKVFVAVVMARGATASDVGVDSCTYNGVAGTPSADEFVFVAPNRHKISTFYWLDADLPASGEHILTATMLTGGDNDLILGWFQKNNLVQKAPEAESSSESTSTNVIDCSITTVTNNAFVIDAGYHHQSSAALTDSSPASRELWEAQSTNISGAFGGHTKVTAGAVAPKWTSDQSADVMAQVAMAFDDFGSPSVTFTLTSNAMLLKANQLQCSGNGLLQKSIATSVTCNAVVAEDTDNRILQFQASGYLRSNSTLTATASSILARKTNAKANAYLAKVRTVSASINGYLREKPGVWRTRSRETSTWNKR